MKRDASQRWPFFVYGTLIPGQPNEHLWGKAIAKTETAVITNCQLYDMGYYPMLVEQQGAAVHGKLITVKKQAYMNILTRLDNLEGFVPDRPRDSTYHRVQRDVMTSTGRTAVSWVYVGHMDQLGDSRLISGGDWVAYAAGKQSEMAAWWESVNTVFGRHGNSKGRAR
jgi:gamma-glutamylcyclotransferase (GGCT)/AIG2-like uncharacterized protein YtfP